MTMNIPNTLTLFRIVLIPVFIWVFYLPQWWSSVLACFVFWLASISDLLDGYLARKLNQQSKLGAFLDPLADKLMVITALILLLTKDPHNSWLLFSTLIIIGREIIISTLREWMASQDQDDVVAVSFLGKAKTVAQMFALCFLIYEIDLLGFPVYTFGLGLLVWASILTILSLAIYLRAAWNTIKTSA